MFPAKSWRLCYRTIGHWNWIPLPVLRIASGRSDTRHSCWIYDLCKPKGLQAPWTIALKAEVRSSFITMTVQEQHPRSHLKGATSRVRNGDQRYPVLCHYQLGQGIITVSPSWILIKGYSTATSADVRIRSGQVVSETCSCIPPDE